jgi:hypothetical protein
MSDGKMQQLIDKIKKQYPTLTNKKGASENYVYVVKNQEDLIAVEKTNSHSDVALTGDITDIKHKKSGIAMMVSSYYGAKNNIYYIPTSKVKGADIERELKQVEKGIKKIVLDHYDISDKTAGDTYCSGTTKNHEVASLLKGFLYEGLSPATLKELNEPTFSYTELLEMVNEDGDAWHHIIKNQKAAQLTCKLLGVRSPS